MIRMYFYYWVIVNYIRRPEQLNLLIKYAAIIALFVFVLVLQQKYLMGFSSLDPFPHQNSMVMYMSILGALLLSYAINQPKSDFPLWGFILTTGFCILSSLSRAGLVLFIFNCLIVLFLSFITRSETRNIKKEAHDHSCYSSCCDSGFY